MIVDISRLDDGKSLTFQMDEMMGIPSGYHLVNESVLVHIDGDITRHGLLYRLKAAAETEMTFHCGRCLEPVSRRIKVEVLEHFSQEEQDLNEEMLFWPVAENKIDLLPSIRENLFSNLPMQIACSTTCKGLCPSCGKNLNQGDCTCDISSYDPRFDSLRSLFIEKEV